MILYTETTPILIGMAIGAVAGGGLVAIWALLDGRPSGQKPPRAMPNHPPPPEYVNYPRGFKNAPPKRNPVGPSPAEAPPHFEPHFKEFQATQRAAAEAADRAGEVCSLESAPSSKS